MTLKQFIQENNVISYETVNNNLIINAVVGQATYGLNVDTSNIPSGTPVVRFDNFTMNGDLLTVDGITVNVNEINMLGGFDELPID